MDGSRRSRLPVMERPRHGDERFGMRVTVKGIAIASCGDRWQPRLS